MDDLDDNNGLDKTFLEHIQKSLLALVNVLTTEDTIDDSRRVEIFLAEIFDLIEHRQDYNYHIFKCTSDALAIRANDRSCPDIELDRTILLIRNTMERFPYPLDTGYISLGRLATALHTRFTKSKNIDDSDESLYITRHICELDPGLGISFSNLGAILVEKFQSGVGNEDDLLESVSALRRAYELVPESANYRLQCLLNLTVALTLAYEKFSQPEYLEEAIDKNRLIMMIKTEKDISDSGSSILNANMSVSLNSLNIGKSDEKYVNSLSNLLLSRYKLYGNKEDLNEAIEIGAAILDSKTIDNGTDRCRALERLAYYLQSRVERDGNLDDANAIVEIHREVLQLRMSESESHRPDSLNNLGSALDERYKITGDKNSLDEAIAIFREAETITPESQDIRSYILHNLSNALRERYYATGADLDLEESILLLRETLRLRPTGHELRYSTLHSLSTSLKQKYERLSSSILGAATTSFWRNLDDYYIAQVPWSPNIFSLGGTFRELFQKSKEKEYIDESIKCLEEALTLTVNTPSTRVLVLHSLGNSLWSRSTSHFVEVQYFLNDFIQMKMKSVETPGSILIILNDQLEKLRQFDSISSFGDVEDINLAISCYKEATELGNFGITHSHSLLAIANSLSVRFHYNEDIKDLQEAAGIYQGLMNESEYHFNPSTIANFARILMKTFIATKNHIYLEDAVTQYRTATNIVSTALLQRQATARKWAHAVRGYHESAVEAYQIAIALLPEIAATNLNVDSRREALQEADAATICHEGVGCALQFGRLEEAVEFLEQGRAIYWSQVLQLRSPVEALLQKAPELANALQSISSQLQLASLRDSLPNDIHNPQQRRNYEHETAYYEDMQLEWEKVLKEIRNLNGFEDFLLPKKFSTLQKYLEPDETIVLLSETGGFDTASALLISHNEVRHLPLPEIDGGMIAVILPMIKEGRNSVGYRHRSPSIAEIPGIHIPAQVYDEKVQELMQTYRHGRARYETSKKDTSLRDALRWIWDGVSKPIIQALGIEKSGNPKRVWWCPTGPFSFLPLHAAGIYEEDISLSEFQSECVSDYLISSYIPTIGSLLSRRSNPPEASIHSNAELEMMVVLESRTLPWTVEELRRIKKHVIPEQLTILGDGPHNPATVESVVSRLPTASIVHFSCHGLQNVDNPLESALVMDDGLITIRHIMQQPMPHSYLAFLCACETATGSEELADEAMSLGTSLLYSGFQSVVATMWSIADEDGATIADNFYEYLFNESKLRGEGLSLSDKNQSAHALHYAVKALRDNGVPLERWIPFIHMGM